MSFNATCVIVRSSPFTKNWLLHNFNDYFNEMYKSRFPFHTDLLEYTHLVNND